MGWRVYPDHRRVRRQTGVRFQRKLATMVAQLEAGAIDLTDVQASLASWIGHLQHGDTWGLRRKLLQEAVFIR